MSDRLDDAIELLKAPPPLSVEARVMAEIRRLPAPVVPRRLGARRIAPWAALALAAGVAAVAFFGSTPNVVRLPNAGQGIAQFVGHFPGARSVEVVGSFNDWSRGLLHLRDDDNDGIWHGDAVLPAGPHEYMFVVDGDRWVPDPLAGRFVDDGFGRENSVLIVRPAVQP
jgi:hypothetical protein